LASNWPLLDEAADVPNRLAHSLLIFHQGDTHVAFAAFAEQVQKSPGMPPEPPPKPENPAKSG
jgi:hypothetical protein